MELRREPRHPLTSQGRYRRGQGRAYKVLFEDISASGCRFNDLVGRLSRDDTLTIRIGDIGPIDARVAWCERRSIGIEFKPKLHPAVLDHINRTNLAPTAP